MPLTANGVSVQTEAWILTGLKLAVPSSSSKGVTVPGRHGALPADRKVYDPATVVASWTVAGCQHDGTIPGGSTPQQQMQLRVAELTRLLAGRVVLGDVRADGTAQRITGVVQDVVEVDRVGSGTAAKVSAALVCEDPPFWTDVTPVSQTLTLASGATGSLTAFAAATAPMTDLTVTFGQGSNPVFTQVSTGVFLAYGAVIASGRQLAVDCGRRELGQGTGAAWNPQAEWPFIQFGGSVGSLFELRPEPSGAAPVVSLGHTGGGTMQATVSGRRAYLVG